VSLLVNNNVQQLLVFVVGICFPLRIPSSLQKLHSTPSISIGFVSFPFHGYPNKDAIKHIEDLRYQNRRASF
jgi:hypothetical protein